MNPPTQQLVQLLVQQLPSIISMVRADFVNRNPGAPIPTNEEVLTGFEAAFADSRAKDETYLATHPEL